MNRTPILPVPDPDDADASTLMRGDIAAKLLAAWLANRRQTLMPHTLNFRAMAPGEVGLLIRMMAAAAQAGAAVTDLEHRQASLALTMVNADSDERAQHERELAVAQPVSTLLHEVSHAGLAAHAYGCALLATDRSSPICQAFLAYLAARLALPLDLAQALESRYRI